MILLSLAFHAPIIYAATILARSTGDSSSARLRDAFLIGLTLLQVEWLVLGSLHLWHPAAVFGTHVAFAAAAFFRNRSKLPVGSTRSAPLSPAISAAVGGILATLGAAALARTFGLPDPFDSWTYHLMIPARAFESGGIPLVATYFGDLAPTYTPAAIEGFYAALFLPFGNDGAARIGQLPFALLALLSVARLARLGGAGPLAIATATIGFLFLPELFIQATDSMVDVAAAALFLAVVDQLCHLERDETPARRWWLIGATVGLFVGSRFTSLVFLPALVLLAVPFIGRRGRGWGIVAIGALLVGSYPYLRNLFLTGNPIYPLATSILGVELPGLFSRDATAASAYHLTNFEQAWTVILDRFRLPGIAWAAVGVALPWRPGGGTIARWLATMALLSGLLHFVAIPYDANLRFLFGGWGCAVAAATITLQPLRGGVALLAALAAASLGFGAVAVADLVGRKLVPGSLGFDLARIFPLALGAVACLGAALGWTLGDRVNDDAPTPQRGAVLRRATLGVTLLIVLVGLEFASHHRGRHAAEIHARDIRLVGAAEIFRRLEQIEGSRTIAYAGLNTPYLLRGAHGQHRVVYVPLDGSPLDSLPHQLARPTDPLAPTPNHRPDESRWSHARWARGLQENGVTDLIVFGRHPTEHRGARQSGFEVVVDTPSGDSWYRLP